MHPYSRGLLASLPDATGSAMRRLSPIPGQPPDLARLPAGCAFAPRCPLATGRCRSETPPLDTLDHATGARVACWRAGDPETARAA
jgi:oligopeptide/dipeptide ABC transporter ATP-binding protein